MPEAKKLPLASKLAHDGLRPARGFSNGFRERLGKMKKYIYIE
jgi:hypothetical protein